MTVEAGCDARWLGAVERTARRLRAASSTTVQVGRPRSARGGHGECLKVQATAAGSGLTGDVGTATDDKSGEGDEAMQPGVS